MFGSDKAKTTATHSNSSTGFLSKLRSSNRPATANKPVYTTGTTRNTTGTRKTGITKKQKRIVATGPAPVSHHKAKPSLSQKVHGAATVMSGKMHNNHREVRAGEKEMQGKTSATSTSGVFGKGSTSTTGTASTRRI